MTHEGEKKSRWRWGRSLTLEILNTSNGIDLCIGIGLHITVSVVTAPILNRNKLKPDKQCPLVALIARYSKWICSCKVKHGSLASYSRINRFAA